MISYLNLNIELVSPECYLIKDKANVFQTKFFLVLASPLACCFLLFGLLISRQTYKYIRKRISGDASIEPDIKVNTVADYVSDEGTDATFVSKSITIMMLMLKLLFITLSKMTLELYQCLQVFLFK